MEHWHRPPCGVCSSETFSSHLDVGLGLGSGVPDGAVVGPDELRGPCQSQPF